MNAQEAAAYEAAKKELERIYDEANAVRRDFKDLIERMAAEILAEKNAA